MRTPNYSSYRGGYKKRGVIFRVVVVTAAVLAALILVLILLLQDYIVFTKDGIRIELGGPATTTAPVLEDEPAIVTQKPTEPATTKPAEIPAAVIKNAAAACLPAETLTAEMLDEVISYGADTVIIEYKAESGVTYPDDPALPSLSEMVRLSKDKKLNTIIRISCFKDATYSKTANAPYLKTSGGVLWIDRYNTPWIDAYSQTGREFVLDAIKTAAAAEPDGIILDNAGFPSAGQLNLINYGANDGMQARRDCISDFLAEVKTKTSGVPVWVCCDYDALLGGGLTGLSLDDITEAGFGIAPVFTAASSGAFAYPAIERNANISVDGAAVSAAVSAAMQDKTAPPVFPVMRMFSDQPQASLISRVLPALRSMRALFPPGLYAVYTNNGLYNAELFKTE